MTQRSPPPRKARPLHTLPPAEARGAAPARRAAAGDLTERVSIYAALHVVVVDPAGGNSGPVAAALARLGLTVFALKDPEEARGLVEKSACHAVFLVAGDDDGWVEPLLAHLDSHAPRTRVSVLCASPQPGAAVRDTGVLDLVAPPVPPPMALLARVLLGSAELPPVQPAHLDGVLREVVALGHRVEQGAAEARRRWRSREERLAQSQDRLRRAVVKTVEKGRDADELRRDLLAAQSRRAELEGQLADAARRIAGLEQEEARRERMLAAAHATAREAREHEDQMARLAREALEHAAAEQGVARSAVVPRPDASVREQLAAVREELDALRESLPGFGGALDTVLRHLAATVPLPPEDLAKAVDGLQRLRSVMRMMDTAPAAPVVVVGRIQEDD